MVVGTLTVLALYHTGFFSSFFFLWASEGLETEPTYHLRIKTHKRLNRMLFIGQYMKKSFLAVFLASPLFKPETWQQTMKEMKRFFFISPVELDPTSYSVWWDFLTLCLSVHTHMCTCTHTQAHVYSLQLVITHLYFTIILSSDAHFHQSPVIETDPLKFQKTHYFNPPQDLGQIKIQFWSTVLCLVSHYFHGAVDRPVIISKQNSSFGSVQKTDVLNSASGPQRHHVLAEVSGRPCVVHAQRVFCCFFSGSIPERKVNSWSEATLRQLFQDWLSLMCTSTFPVLFTTTDFVFCKSGVLLNFFIIGTLCPIKLWSLGHFVL